MPTYKHSRTHIQILEDESDESDESLANDEYSENSADNKCDKHSKQNNESNEINKDISKLDAKSKQSQSTLLKASLKIYNSNKKRKTIFSTNQTTQNIEKKNSYIQSLLDLLELKYAFTNDELNLIFNQIMINKKYAHPLLSYKSTSYGKIIKLITHIINLIEMSSDDISIVLNVITNDEKDLFPYDKLNKLIITKNQWIEFIKYPTKITYPLDQSLSYDIYESMLIHLSENNDNFKRLYSTTSYHSFSKLQAQNYANLIKPNFTYDKLLTYMNNISEELCLGLLPHIHSISDWFLTHAQKTNLIDAYIDKCIHEYKTNKLLILSYSRGYKDIMGMTNLKKLIENNMFDYMILNSSPDKFNKVSHTLIEAGYIHDFIKKLSSLSSDKIFHYIMLQINSNQITSTDFKLMLNTHMEQNKCANVNEDYYEKEKLFFIEHVNNLKLTEYDEPYEESLYCEYFLHTYVDVFFKFTINDLEMAYGRENISIIDYLNNKIMPTIKCLEFACQNKNMYSDNDSIYRITELINKKLLPNKQCLLSAIDNSSYELIKLLTDAGCKMDNDCVKKLVESHLIEKYDFDECGVNYDNNLKKLCIKHNVDMDTINIRNKFPVDHIAKQFHHLCITQKWPSVESYAIKYDLKFDQSFFNLACTSPVAHPRPYYALLKLYCLKYDIEVHEMTDPSSPLYDYKPEFGHDKNILIEKCKFKVTFHTLRLVEANSKLCTLSMINILDYQYNNSNFSFDGGDTDDSVTSE